MGSTSEMRGVQNKSVGYYEDEEEAALEYDKAILELRGPSAQLNLPHKRPVEANSKQGSIQMPSSTEEEIALAVQSIVAAFRAGEYRSLLTFILSWSSLVGGIDEV